MYIVFFSGCEGDTQRYRCDQAAEQLRRRGYRADVFWQSDESVLAAAATADAIVLHRPARTHFSDALMRVAAGRPLIYETDDLIFDPALADDVPLVAQSQGMLRQRWRNYVLGNARLLARCDAALTSTTPLAERLTSTGRRAWVHPNAVSDELLELSDRVRANRRRNRPLTIGYFSGTRSHDADFGLIAPVLARLMARHAGLRLLIGGYLTLPDELTAFEERIEHRAYVAWRELPASMADADLLLAPLDLDSPFAVCRSELKYLEAAALAIPIVASPAPAFAGAIRHGETGFLARTHDEWEESLERLLAGAELRAMIGAAALDHVRESYTLDALAPRLDATLQQIIASHAPRDVAASPDHAALLDQWRADRRLDGRAIFMLTGCDIAGAGAYRCRHRQEQLDLHEVRSTVVSQYDDGVSLSAAITFDLGILHRVAYDQVIGAYIDLMRRMGRPVLFDTDDLVFRPELIGYVHAIRDWPAAELAIYRDGVERYQRTLLACDAAIVSTESLAQQVRALGQRAFVVRNALGWQQIERGAPLADERLQRPLPAADAPVVIGYFSGSATHDHDFQQAAPALRQILAESPHTRLRIVGPLELDPSFASFAERIERRDLVPLADLPAEIAAVDIALAPLELDNPYCQAKSEVKYMEAATVAVPIVASPTEAFCYAIRDGDNGMLARDTAAWLAALRALVADPARRRAMGAAARADMLERYTPAARSRQLLDVLAQLWEEYEPARRSASFNDVFLHSLDRLQELAILQEQTAAARREAERTASRLEEQLAVSRGEVEALRQLLDQIARGRVMRLLNALTRRH